MNARKEIVSTISLAKTTRRPADGSEIAALIRRSFGIIRSNPLETLELASEAVRQARQIGETGLEAEALIACGEACYRLGRIDEHVAYYERVEELTPDIPDLPLRAKTLRELGRAHHQRGKGMAALRFHRAALEITRRLNEPASSALTIESMGHIHLDRGNYSRTLHYYLRALRIRERIGEPFRIAVSLLHIGKVYGMLHDYTAAREYFLRCLELSLPLGNPALPATAEGSLGTIYVVSGAPQEGLLMIRRALTTLLDLNETQPAINLMSNAGAAYAAMGDYSRSLEFHREALAEAERLRLSPMLLFILSSMGKVYQQLGNFRSAFDCYRKALKVYPQGSADSRLQIHTNLSELYAVTRDYRRALEHQRTQGKIQEKILGTARMRAVAAVETHHATLTADRHEKSLQQRAEQAERNVEAKTREINSLMLNLTRRDEALKAIREFLKPISGEARGKTRGIVKQVLADIDAALDAHGEYKVVEQQFEIVHRDFMQRLSLHCRRLTPTEIRICVLVRLNLSIKQIADTLFASELTVRTHRKHIRKKLELTPTENLASVLLSI